MTDRRRHPRTFPADKFAAAVDRAVIRALWSTVGWILAPVVLWCVGVWVTM